MDDEVIGNDNILEIKHLLKNQKSSSSFCKWWLKQKKIL